MIIGNVLNQSPTSATDKQQDRLLSWLETSLGEVKMLIQTSLEWAGLSQASSSTTQHCVHDCSTSDTPTTHRVYRTQYRGRELTELKVILNQ